MNKKSINLPTSFLPRNHKHDYINSIIKIFNFSLFHGWNEEKINKLIKKYVHNGLFVVVHKSSNIVVLTMAVRP